MKNVTVSRSDEKCVFVFMSDEFHDCIGTVIVYNKGTLYSPSVVETYPLGVSV